MNKKVIGIIIIIAILIVIGFSLSSHSEPKTTTYLNVGAESCSESGNDGKIGVTVKINESDPKYNSSNYWDFENSTIYVNLTYENNTTVGYKVFCDFFGTGKITDLEPGDYKVSASYAGDDEYNASSIKQTVHVGEKGSYGESSSGESSSFDNEQYNTTTYVTYRWVYV